MSDVFISYSREDKAYARYLALYLKEQGFDVWIDNAIRPSEDWWEAIRRALAECSAVIVIMSPEAEKSEWVQNELEEVKNLKPVFPLLYRGENWPRFSRVQYEDVRSGDPPSQEFINALAEAVRRAPKPSRREPAAPRPDHPPTASADSLVEWCQVPAGWVTLEDAAGICAAWEGHDLYGTISKKFYIPAFALAKYPVTNADYNRFLRAPDGYSQERWWDFSQEALAWRRKNAPGRNYAAPRRGDDLPRVFVSWYSARAYCRWLGAQSGETITLPTEQQWQRAAQGDDDRMFAWGSKLRPDFCNYGQHVDQLTPVTTYRQGRSPYDVMDLCGNAWEWCLNEWGADDAQDLGSAPRVIRGGSYTSDDPAHLRVTFRFWNNADGESDQTGFRCARLDTL